LIVYSIAARFGGSGIGYTAAQAVTGIHRAGLLRRLFASSTATAAVPGRLMRHWGIIGRGFKYLGAKDPTALLYYLESRLFDAWVAAQMPSADVFHGWSSMCLLSLRAARRSGMLTIVERPSSHTLTQNRLLREEYRRWGVPVRVPTWSEALSIREMQEADYITIASPFVRQSMLEAGLPVEKLIEIPYGVDLSRFQPPTAPASHPFRAIFAGQISLRKGVPYLLDAWQRLGWTDAELWLVGAPTPDFAAIRRRWPALAGVRFIPHTPDLPALFAQSDLFVLPTIEEGSALVTYEALAAGLPVLTTPHAGSIVRDGIEGFLVPIRDVEALCQRLEQLRADFGLRRQMAVAARQRVAGFTWDHYRERLLAAYRRIAPRLAEN